MAFFKLVLESSPPTTLEHRAVVLVGSSGDYQIYAGDSNNNPVQVTPDVPAQPYAHTSIVAVDSPYTPTHNATRNFVLADATNGVIEVNLPPSVNWGDQVITIKKRDTSANNVNINADTGDTIEGVGTVSLQNDYEYISVYSDGGDVYQVAGNV